MLLLVCVFFCWFSTLRGKTVVSKLLFRVWYYTVIYAIMRHAIQEQLPESELVNSAWGNQTVGNF